MTSRSVPLRRRRILLVSGALVLLCGLALLDYVGWQLVGTNIVSKHRQAATVTQLQEDWSRLPATTVTRDGPVPTGTATALVRVPRFGDDYVVPVLEGVGADQLSGGYGHFEDSAAAGGTGNYALTAHRITHGEPLRDMPSLRPGDQVLVETRQATYTYELDTDPRDLEVDHDAAWVLAAHPVNPRAGGPQPTYARRLITLVTCAELFHTDERMVAFGHLVATTPR